MPLLRKVTTPEEPTAAREPERRVGLYRLREYTARRLVAERAGAPLIAMIAVSAVFLLLTVVIAPWHGGTRILIAISLTLIAVGIGLLIAGFVPRLERITVDVGTRECLLEQMYLLGHRARILRIPLEDVREVRCRRRVWEDTPDEAVVRWAVEMSAGEKVMRLAEAEDEESMQELTRLVAKVAGVPQR